MSKEIRHSASDDEIRIGWGSRLFEAPLESVFCVFDVESDFGETVANEIACRPVFSRFCFGTNLKQEVDGFFKRFC